MDGWMDGWMGGWVDGWMDGWIDGCMSVDVSCPQSCAGAASEPDGCFSSAVFAVGTLFFHFQRAGKTCTFSCVTSRRRVTTTGPLHSQHQSPL